MYSNPPFSSVKGILSGFINIALGKAWKLAIIASSWGLGDDGGSSKRKGSIFTFCKGVLSSSTTLPIILNIPFFGIGGGSCFWTISCKVKPSKSSSVLRALIIASTLSFIIVELSAWVLSVRIGSFISNIAPSGDLISKRILFDGCRTFCQV